MGMFDEVVCRYPLPWPEVQDATWQSKGTPAQYLDQYEIRADGSLWHLAYTQRFEDLPNDSIGFRIHHDDQHWVHEAAFCGELEVHHWVEPTMYSARFWFRDGRVRDAVFRKTPDDERAEKSPA